MLNREIHQVIMGQVLRDIYSDITISPFLGFKDGTCAYFFYDLPRFSVDLDFDLISIKKDEFAKKEILEKIVSIVEKYGNIKDKHIKYNSIFCLLSYGDEEHNIKIEINTRGQLKSMTEQYELNELFGISMLTATKDYLVASKFHALLNRSQVAPRDVYDIYYFLKNNWGVNKEMLEDLTGEKSQHYLVKCIEVVSNVKDNQILQGLGELLSVKEKAWVKENLKTETIFLLKNYLSAIR